MLLTKLAIAPLDQECEITLNSSQFWRHLPLSSRFVSEWIHLGVPSLLSGWVARKKNSIDKESLSSIGGFYKLDRARFLSIYGNERILAFQNKLSLNATLRISSIGRSLRCLLMNEMKQNCKFMNHLVIFIFFYESLSPTHRKRA